LTGDSIALSTGPVGLVAQYYCQSGWTLRLPIGATTAVAPPGQMCVEHTTDPTSGIMTAYSWSAVDLSFMTSNGTTAMSTGHLTGPFSASDGSSGSCTVAFTGPLGKS
jgi:hypothetical protein